MWMEEMVKKPIVYNTKKEEKKRDGRKTDWKRKREIKREQKGLKKYNSKKEEYSTLRLIIWACPRILSEYVRR